MTSFGRTSVAATTRRVLSKETVHRLGGSIMKPLIGWNLGFGWPGIENSESEEVESQTATHSPMVNMIKSTGPFFEAATHAFWTSSCDVASPLTRTARPD